jgi:hypothetical protein
MPAKGVMHRASTDAAHRKDFAGHGAAVLFDFHYLATF